MTIETSLSSIGLLNSRAEGLVDKDHVRKEKVGMLSVLPYPLPLHRYILPDKRVYYEAYASEERLDSCTVIYLVLEHEGRVLPESQWAGIGELISLSEPEQKAA